jgi:hypothetical protein
MANIGEPMRQTSGDLHHRTEPLLITGDKTRETQPSESPELEPAK